GHLTNASTVLRGGEVGADPTAQIDALADVETPSLCIGEHVHTGFFGQPFGQVTSGLLSPGDRFVHRTQFFQAVYPQGPKTCQEAVENLDGGTGVVQGPVVGEVRGSEMGG